MSHRPGRKLHHHHFPSWYPQWPPHSREEKGSPIDLWCSSLASPISLAGIQVFPVSFLRHLSTLRNFKFCSKAGSCCLSIGPFYSASLVQGPEEDRKDGRDMLLPCSLCYTIYVFLVNAIGKRDDAEVATTVPNFNPQESWSKTLEAFFKLAHLRYVDSSSCPCIAPFLPAEGYKQKNTEF